MSLISVPNKFGIQLADPETAFDFLKEVAKSGFFTEGEMVRNLEESVSLMYEQNAVAFNSAGTALFSVMRQLTKGLWLVPNNTFFATGAMVQEAGNTIYPVDCNRVDFSMSVEALEKTYERFPHAVGVVLTHVGGTIACDYEEIAMFCSRNNLGLVEDAAHALGVDTDRYVPGHLSQAAVFSFYPTKAIPAGEGGMVVTDDTYLADELRKFRNYGKTYTDDGVSYGRGFNFRMDEWTAAIAYSQMECFPQILDKRWQDFDALSRIIPHIVPNAITGNYYKYIVDAKVAEELGIIRFTGQVYAGYDQLAYCLKMPEALEYLPNSAWVSENHRCLPLGSGAYIGMEDDELLEYLQGGPRG